MARRNAKTPPPSIESYLFEVSIGDPSYGLSLANPKREPGLYSEHWHLELEGRCIAPTALAGRMVRLLFVASRDYFEHRSADPTWRPPGAGRLTIRKDQADYVSSLPYEAAWNVAIGVAVGLFKYVHMSGPPLKYSASHIRHLSFQVHGNAARSDAIFQANRNILNDPDRIYIGQVLMLPAEAPVGA